MRKSSIDRPWARTEQSYSYKSEAMPGFRIRVWRTDGVKSPPSATDVDCMVHLPLKKNEVTHLRNYSPSGLSATFDVTVETMPSVPELPEGASDAAAALTSAR